MPLSLSHDSITVTDPYSIVHLFNNYFNSVFNNSSFVLPSIDKLPTPSSQLNHIEIEECDVYEALMSLKTSKASGCDDISPYFLKLCGGPLLTSITNLLSLSITSCSVPQEWKTHKICPIFKGGNSSCASNYRPISLLCIH